MWGTNTLGRSAYFPSTFPSPSFSSTSNTSSSISSFSSSRSQPIQISLNQVPLASSTLDQRKFPTVRTVLWDRPGSEATPINLSYRSTIPGIQFTRETLNKLLESSLRQRLQTTSALVPNKQTLQIELEPPEGPEDPHVFIFHPFTHARASSLFYIANLLADNDPTVTSSSSTFYNSTVKNLKNNNPPSSLSSTTNTNTILAPSIPLPEYQNPLCMTIDFNGVKTIEDYRTGMNIITLHVILRIFTPCITLRFTHLRLPPPRLADTPVTVALLTTGLRGIASPILGTQCGVLTLDSTRRIVPLLPSDPSCRTVPLVGVWIRAPVTNSYELYEDDNWSRTLSTPAWARTALRHPFLRTVLAWYEECTELGERVRLPEQPYTCLVMLLPPFNDDPSLKEKMVNNIPIFFECDVQWPRTPILSPQTLLQKEMQKSTNISLSQSTSRLSSSSSSTVINNHYSSGSNDSNSTDNIPVPDGWSLITSLLRVRLRCITSTEYEPIFASSDIGNICILPNNEGIRWSLRSTAPYLKKSITQYLAPSIQHSIVHNHYQNKDRYGTTNEDVNNEKNTLNETTDTALNNAVTSMLDYSTSKLPLPVYKRSVAKETRNTPGALSNSIGDPSRSNDDGNNPTGKSQSPTRIPLPKGLVASPRSYNKESWTSTGESVVSGTIEKDSEKKTPTKESTRDDNTDNENTKTISTMKTPSLPSESINSPSSESLNTNSSTTKETGTIATPGPIDNPEALTEFKLTPETHKQLQNITNDLSSLSTVLHEHLQPTPKPSGTLFSDSLRNQLAHKDNKDNTVSSVHASLSSSLGTKKPDYKAAERIGYVSALLQGLTNTLQSTLPQYSNHIPSEEANVLQGVETVSVVPATVVPELNADSDGQTKAAMHRLRTLIAKTNTPLPPVPVSVAPIIMQSQQRYPRYTTSDATPTPLPITSYVLPSNVLQPTTETVLNNFSSFEMPGKEIGGSEVSSLTATGNDNIENVVERTRHKILVGAQLPSPALRHTVSEIAKSTVLPYNETSTNNMLSSSSRMSMENITLIHNINNVLSPSARLNNNIGSSSLSSSLRWLPTTEYNGGGNSLTSSFSMSASVSPVPVSTKGSMPVSTIVSMKPYSSQSEPVSLLYSNASLSSGNFTSSPKFPRGTVDQDYFSLVAPRTEALIRASSTNNDTTIPLLRTFGQMMPNSSISTANLPGSNSKGRSKSPLSPAGTTTNNVIATTVTHSTSTSTSPLTKSINTYSSHSSARRTPSSGSKQPVVRTNTPVRMEDVRNDMETYSAAGVTNSNRHPLDPSSFGIKNDNDDGDSDDETYIDPATRREMDLLSSSVLMQLPSSWI